MQLAIEILLDGFVISAILALGTIGLTVIYGVSGVLNLCHGSIMVLAGLVSWYCSESLNAPPVVAALIGVAASIATTYLLYFVIVMPIQRSNHIQKEEIDVFVFVATLLVAIVLQGVMEWAFGSTPVTTEPLIHGSVTLGVNNSMSLNELFIVGVAWLVLILTWLLTTRTKYGKALLAVSMSPTGVAIIGYNIKQLYIVVWGIYGILAGVAGVLLTSFLGASPSIAIELTGIAFAIVVLGGLGSVVGSLAAAYILGYVGSLTAYLLSPSIRDLPGLIILILILYVRPNGLVGRRK